MSTGRLGLAGPRQKSTLFTEERKTGDLIRHPRSNPVGTLEHWVIFSIEIKEPQVHNESPETQEKAPSHQIPTSLGFYQCHHLTASLTHCNVAQIQNRC